ncbi:MAG: chorismate synthase [Caldilineales bacterium]|nr:chorismate synthase [Caldilineales bacterium]
MPLRFLTAGESHGPELTAILEGMPAGLPIDADFIASELARRQQAYGAGGRMKIESDTARITAGVMNGHTTGAPIALTVANKDWKNWATKDIPPLTTPRPGHADLTGAVKYGYPELRLALERASARETAARVAVGAICKQYLAVFGGRVQGYVLSIGSETAAIPDDMPYDRRFELAESNDLRCPDLEAVERMRRLVWECMQAKDTLGGVFEMVGLGLPPGLGSHVHWDRRLSTRLLAAVGSIHAIKGVEIGPAFANAARFGSEVHDEIFRDEAGNLIRHSNRSGGLEGGISTGEPIVVRAAMKPISTVLNPRQSVNLATGVPEPTTYERSDFNAVPRAVVVGEAMVAFVLADALLEKLGGDSITEQSPRFETLRRAHLDDLPMDNAPWRFGFGAA